MCGIAGVLDARGTGPADREAVERALELMHHRGPDDRGFAAAPFAALGHLRLSIIDLSTGHQPMASEDGRLIVIFNGEIFNFHQIKTDLERRGHQFRTHSDTEVILAAYRQYGAECVHQFNGMFAFAVADLEKREVFLARDRLGVKPLYYQIGPGGRLAFASELKAFLAIGEGRLEIDPQGLDCFLALRYVAAPRTLLKGIAKLPPGHRLRWSERGHEVDGYWDLPPYSTSTLDPKEAGEQLRALLTDAVKLRLISDVPLGLTLSGGLDSTIIAALMHQLKGEGIKTFSVATTGGGSWDERPFAKKAAERYGTQHFEIEVTPDDFLRTLPAVAWQLDDLIGDPSSILLYHLCELARREVTVVLSGEGSDEILAGYPYETAEKPWARQAMFNRLPSALMPLLGAGRRFSDRLSRYLDSYGWDRANFVCERFGVQGLGVGPELRRALMAPGLRESAGGSMRSLIGDVFHRRHEDELLDLLLYGDTRVWLPDNLLTKADRMSMAHSLELRTPFLDYRLVEYCATLPLALKKRQQEDGRWSSKALLREVFAQDIPPEILHRKKQGFPTNWQRILLERGLDQAKESLLDGSLDALIDRAALADLLTEESIKDERRGQAAFSLLLFSHWHRRFFGAEKVAQVPSRVAG